MILFYLFLFVVPYDSIGLSSVTFQSTGVSLARPIGYIFFATCLLFRRQALRRPPPGVGWFLLYLVILSASPLWIFPVDWAVFLERVLSIASLTLFLWVSTSLLASDDVLRRAVLAFSLGAAALSVAAVGGVGALSLSFIRTSSERLSILSYNANALAVIVGLAVVFLTWLAICSPQASRKRMFLTTPLVLPLLVVLVATGSRAGILATLAGLATVAVASRSGRARLVAIVLVGLVASYTAVLVAGNIDFLERTATFIQDRDLRSREEIYVQAVAMSLERPLVGWGVGENILELGSRTGRPTADPHNLILYLVTEVGLLGTIPFLFGLYSCLRSIAVTPRGAPGWGLALAFLILMAVVSLAHNTVRMKTMWFGFAVALAMPKMAGGVDQRRVWRRKTVRACLRRNAL